MLRGRVLQILVLLIVAGLLLSPPARPAAASTAALPRAQTAPLDPAELAAWLEPLIEEQMAAAHIPGAVFLLVQDGQIAYARAFGLADLAQQTPVDVESSLWRVMSLSKPVTAVALMQLAEQGKLDLHADANTYLRSYRLPEAFGQPITADQLLTHSAGLDWDLDDIGTAAATPAELVGNARFLNDHPPARVFPPGPQTLYSNAAFDIAGQMVEDVSGVPFAEYVDRNIFEPLGMTRSSFVQPPPQPEGLVTGYEFDGENHQPVPLPLWQDPPSRALTATAPDMARFMQALLGGGSPILSADAAATLLDTHFTYREGTPGVAYGWDVVTRPGVAAVWKDGGAAGALSRIVLLPEEGSGFFLAYNLDDGFGLGNAVMAEFLERRFPVEPHLAPSPPGAAERGQALAGVYRLTDYSRHTIAKLLRLPWPDYPQVTAGADGRLLVQFGPDAAAAHELVEIAPHYYRTSDGEADYVFWAEEPGRPAGFAVGAWVTEKVAWYDTGQAHMLMLVAFAAIFLGSAVAGAVIGLRQPPANGLARRGLWLLTATAALNFTFLVTFFLVLQWVVSGAANVDFNIGMPVWMAALVALPLLTTALTVGLLAVGLLGWRRHAWSGRGLMIYGLFTGVSLLFIPWLNYWNLLGFRW
jgi:CubicO group peptidase (beta-lactamase class C family)